MAAKPGRGKDPAAKEAALLTEVEKGLASTTPVPDEIAAETPRFDVADAEVTTALKLRNLWNNVKQRETQWLNAKNKADKALADLATEQERLKADRAALAEREERAAEREAALARAEAEIESQRSAAKAGFADELRTMTKDAACRRDELLAEAATIEDEARRRADAIRSAAHDEVQRERERITAETVRLRDLQADLNMQKAQLEHEIEWARTREAMAAEHLERRTEERVTLIRADLDEARQMLEIERDLRQSRDQALRDLRNQLDTYGDDPQILQEENDALRSQVANLRDELSRRPSQEQVDDLRQRAQRAEEAQEQETYWRQQHDRIDRQLRYQLMNVGELEVLRDERDTLAAQRETLRQALAQQRKEWEDLQASQNVTEPFPACSAYDRDSGLQQWPAEFSDLGADFTLAHLVVDIRARMATASPVAFYYTESDVRLFMAGLAASRLHLLQGMSGTGKTSLPREFFQALSGDGAAQMIEVQAGWRDKDDLFGYYNAFEKRFAESEFTKALYRALLPANEDRPMVIVLDEMNLAHPEQYFGSMLSILETAVSEPGYVDLLTHELQGVPERFEGSRLPLARNVWFVGTANHDETTVAFADKTYDRAHVQELPARHEPFAASKQAPAAPIAFSELRGAFEAAMRDHRADADTVKQFLNDHLHERFARFGVSWGNRFERQAERFVPVILATGGDMTEAVDHLVATKLVRKLEDRFGVVPDQLAELADDIEKRWSLDGGKPVKTLDRIRREASRLRGGYGS
ncbi:dynein-related subfamily AAA family protein [Pseudonocardia hierapolitana]|uniref:Dynein-related subfamily AAA family protein n=1 Tax=Pseudonocardia hierapolitana TaxID=1128676 RepID=A0A561SLA2_9PSEU|nr:AAA family ATPase [Pseudonocardia hierapolitana]TWF75637.1 dynein-related subfamily AAA family protein [Pseudonocardia hierapolitana]